MADINKFLKQLGGYVEPTTQQEYQTEDNSLRNYLANKINPVLDNTVNKIIPEDMGRANIPVLSVGEQKDQDREMLKPENLAMAGVGSMKIKPAELAVDIGNSAFSKSTSALKPMQGVNRQFTGGEAVSQIIRDSAEKLKNTDPASPAYQALREKIKHLITSNSKYSK